MRRSLSSRIDADEPGPVHQIDVGLGHARFLQRADGALGIRAVVDDGQDIAQWVELSQGRWSLFGRFSGGLVAMATMLGM
jgi:hypothetical protein